MDIGEFRGFIKKENVFLDKKYFLLVNQLGYIAECCINENVNINLLIETPNTLLDVYGCYTYKNERYRYFHYIASIDVIKIDPNFNYTKYAGKLNLVYEPLEL